MAKEKAIFIVYPARLDALVGSELHEEMQHCIFEQQCSGCRWLVQERELCGFYVEEDKTLAYLEEHDPDSCELVDGCCTYQRKEQLNG